MPRFSLMVLLLGLTAAGCSAPAASSLPTAAALATAEASEGTAAIDVVRGWLDAQNAGDLEKAATFFAPGARVGPGPQVITNSADDVIAQLREPAKCHHAITSIRQEGRTVYAEVELSGGDCPFLQPGETTHGIQIPAQVVDSKIVCTCPEGT